MTAGTPFGLTAAQRGMWDAEHLQDDYSATVAHYLDIRDTDRPFDRDLFRAGVRQGSRLLETAYSRFTVVDGEPRQYVDLDLPFDVVDVDLRDETDPLAAAHAWMAADHQGLMDVTRDPVAISAFIRVADDRTFWYLRGHHIAFDGFAALTCLHEGVDRYNAAVRGEEYVVAPRATLAEVSADDEKYHAGSRRSVDEQHWRSKVADLPAPVSLSTREPTLRYTADHVVCSRTMDPALQSRVEGAAADLGASTAAVLAAAFAAYLSSAGGRDDIVLTLPVTGRATAKIKRAGGMVANMLPVRLDGVGGHTLASLVEAVTLELTGCLRHQRFPFAEIARAAGIDDPRVTAFGPIVNLVFFDKPLALDGAAVGYHILSSGILQDLRVNLYQAGAGLPIVVDLHGNSTMYGRDEIDTHLEAFLGLLVTVLDAPDTRIAEIAGSLVSR
ncbi:condensation domain-containing protein [Williamsia serinedens]|uniref:Condensation domain-containing protein n=1 Tax=Williamsia serinedens TaxID=391736 RepID=A0ABT1H4A0_9NOCA|nr:condensation domain-containing protein [Williamsia serinedens]MCP2161388.1 Condensation domain-containing protein [Williamsia serinedens]